MKRVFQKDGRLLRMIRQTMRAEIARAFALAAQSLALPLPSSDIVQGRDQSEAADRLIDQIRRAGLLPDVGHGDLFADEVFSRRYSPAEICRRLRESNALSPEERAAIPTPAWVGVILKWMITNRAVVLSSDGRSPAVAITRSRTGAGRFWTFAVTPRTGSKS